MGFAEWLRDLALKLEQKKAELDRQDRERRAREAARLKPLREARDAIARGRGYESYDVMVATRRLRKEGWAWCSNCAINVRPQPPWGPVRILTLGALTPGPFECPRCRGTRFTEPRPLAFRGA